MEGIMTEDVKQDIVEVVSKYVKLEKAGRNFIGVCPFCKETRPAFFVYPNQKSWHCFGCDVGGYEIQFTNRINAR